MRLSDPDPVECPSCHAHALKRRLSAPSFRLAGSGWYETDFKKDGKRNLAGEQGDAKPAGDAKPDAKPEAKPAEKVEAKPAAAPEAKPAAKPDAPSS